jgi:hypothetical protein
MPGHTMMKNKFKPWLQIQKHKDAYEKAIILS